MWPKNLAYYRLTDEIDLGELARAAATRPFVPCQGLDWTSTGFVTVVTDQYLLVAKDKARLTIRTDTKVLPAIIIKEALAAKVQEIEQKENRKVGKREKSTLKEQITDDMLPRAFTKPSYVSVLIDNGAHLIMVDSSSATKVEEALSVIREVMPTLPARLVRCERSPSSLMTEWFAAGETGEAFEMGASCTLRAPGDDGREITVKRADLSDDEIRALTSRGEQCTALSLIWNERIMAKMMDTGHLKGLRFLDTMQEEASASAEEGDLEALASATLLIACDGVTGLINDYIAHAGGEI